MDFQSDELTLFSSNPDFTNCFQKTVLQWTPSLFLLIGFSIYVPCIRTGVIPATALRRFSPVGIAQLVGIVSLIVLSVCDLIVRATTQASSNPVEYMYDTVQILTNILILTFQIFCTRKGVFNTSIACIFWLLTCLKDAVILRSTVLQQQNLKHFLFISFAIGFAISILEFGSTFLHEQPKHHNNDTVYLNESHPLLGKDNPARRSKSRTLKDEKLKDRQTKRNPLQNCSYPIYLLFHWLTPLIVTGYRRQLTLGDIWMCRESDKSGYLFPLFQRNWTKLLQRVAHGKGLDHAEGGILLLKALIRTFGFRFGLAGFILLLYFTCILINPLILSALISFVQSGDPYQWRGYVYAIALFFFTATSNCCFHHHVHTTLTIGTRMRTAITTAIYRKILLASPYARKEITSGEIVNLVSVDVQIIDDAITYLHWGWATPILIPIVMYFLWQKIGAASLAGLLYIVIVVIINSTFIMRKIFTLQQENMNIKDKRLKLLNQVLIGMKVIKLQAWEPHFQEKLEAIRRKETRVLLYFHLMHALSFTLIICTPLVVALLCFATYVLSSPENVLDADTAFVSIYYFAVISIPLNFTPFVYMHCAQVLVAFRRIAKFLLLDDVDKNNVTEVKSIDFTVQIDNGSFMWDKQENITLENISMRVRRGQLVAVVGEVGAGKSSLIAALLGEMIKVKGTVHVSGSKAYIAQQAWIQNMSLRDNILFGSALDEARYDRVIRACALIEDLKTLPAGDSTEIGERGINLSGGQKQRVSLARAIYQDADIYLFDDPLSAVDAHVGNHIFEHVIGRNGILKDKTRIFVTNQVQYLKRTDEILILDRGVLKSSGTYTDLLQLDGSFAEFLRTHHQEDEQSNSDESIDGSIHSNEPISNKLVTRKRLLTAKSMSVLSAKSEPESKLNEALVTEEHLEEGTIKFPVLRWYMAAASAVFLVGVLLGVLFFAALQSSANIWLSEWTNDVTVANGTVSQDKVHMRLGVFAAFCVGEVVCAGAFEVFMAFGATQAARTLHNRLLHNVLRTPMAFFDTTPLGRILNRFSKDIDYLDKKLPQFLGDTLLFGAPLIATLFVIIYSLPILGVLFIPIVLLFVFFQRAYAHTSRQLKRLDSVKRSPVYNFLSETLSGVTSIRAYQCQARFIARFETLLNTSQSIWFAVYSANRWISVNGETTSNLIVLLTAIVAVVQRDTLTAGIAALALTYSLQVGEQLMLTMRSACELENYIIAVERIKEYAEHDTEADWEVPTNRPSKSWPEKGVVEFRSVSAQYREDLDPVLADVSFISTPSEKIGIVGRTGAGKSSLFLVLFRILETCAGSVIIDGKDISCYGLHHVRRKLSIIPQDPVLFSGSIRFNLDPSESSSEANIWLALQHAHLAAFVKTLPGNLEYECGENGENLSVGQRQLVCMARALLKKSKVLVLDEATASIDMETDAIIQETIRTQFQDCTVITIAHRLQTILDSDRVMVLDKGKVVEFDSPSILLKNEQSQFYSLASEANVV